jgi:hypothetical protein
MWTDNFRPGLHDRQEEIDSGIAMPRPLGPGLAQSLNFAKSTRHPGLHRFAFLPLGEWARLMALHRLRPKTSSLL